MADRIEEQWYAILNGLAEGIDSILNPPPAPKSTVFVLLVAEVGENTKCNYISNGDRREMLAMMKDVLPRFESLLDPKPGEA